MERYRITVHIVLNHQTHVFFVNKNQLLMNFKLEIRHQSTYHPFFYHLDTHRILDEQKSWIDNYVFPGDTILYI